MGRKASSQDVRHRALKAVDAGHRQAEVAKTFAGSVATIKRSHQRAGVAWRVWKERENEQ